LIIFEFTRKISETGTVAVAFSMAWLAEAVEREGPDTPGAPGGGGDAEGVDPVGVLAGFRRELHACFTARADALFELADAALCADGPVRTLVELALAPERRRGHGALYDGLDNGRVEVARLRRAVAGLAIPRWRDGRIVLAVDVSPWLRPDAAVSPERLFCHVRGRGKGQAQMIPGWPYSFVGALEPGRSSWTAIMDAARLGPGDDETAVTAEQIREVIARLIEAGHWKDGDPDILVVSPHPREDRPAGQRAETQPTRPRTPTRIKEHPPPTTPASRQTRQTGHHPAGPGQASRLKLKLSLPFNLRWAGAVGLGCPGRRRLVGEARRGHPYRRLI
jgi:hypothetical protein